MKLQHLGTEYGGWTVDIESIQDGDIIIDAGLGEDVSFITELNKIKNVNFIGIDPTIKSHKYVENLNIKNLQLIKKAIGPESDSLMKIYKNSNPEWVSESCYSDHANINVNEYYEIETVTFTTLIEKYKPSLIKMDIEGTEYDVLKQCVGIKQICVEFHHKQISNKNSSDTQSMISYMKKNGYTIINSTNDNQEVTFLLT